MTVLCNFIILTVTGRATENNIQFEIDYKA